ncbi:MAG: tetratricopeptide repeat protein [Candidatus Omnitrophica bacterium]|nr:tetratricopeptide repeat protein [Candidatus Omnitrophota bacterium]
MGKRCIITTLLVFGCCISASAGEKGQNGTEALIASGLKFYGNMEYQKAVDCFKAAAAIEPDNPELQERLGDIYAGLGDYDAARASYEAAIRCYRKSRLSDRNKKIGHLKRLVNKLPSSLSEITRLLDSGEFDNVLTLCKKRIAMNPGDVTAVTCMGMAYAELGHWREAEKLYKTAIKRSPDYPAPHFYLANIYLTNRKDPQRAVKEIETYKDKLEELLGIDKRARDGLAAALRRLIYIHHEILRDYETAVGESKNLLKLEPESQEGHYNLGLSYAYLGKKSMAYAEFQKAINLNPDTRIGRAAQDAIEWLRRYPATRTLPYSRTTDE